MFAIKRHARVVAPTWLQCIFTAGLDWLFVAILAVVVASLEFNMLHRGNRMHITELDLEQLKYPFLRPLISSRAARFGCILIPAILVLLHSHMARAHLSVPHAGLLGLFMAVLITALLADILKLQIGRPRPDFFYRCFPDGVAAWTHPLHTHRASVPEVLCHPLHDTDVVEGYKSFPSDHAAWTCAAVSYTWLYLWWQLRALKGVPGVAYLAAVVAPVALAIWASASRVADYWHFASDVVVGAALGIAVGVLCFVAYFPAGSASAEGQEGGTSSERPGDDDPLSAPLVGNDDPERQAGNLS